MNIELKNQVLQHDLLPLVAKRSYYNYRLQQSYGQSYDGINCSAEIDYWSKLIESIDMQLFQFPVEVQLAATNEYKNSRSRSAALHNKLNKWMNLGYVYFITFTFRDSTLENTSSASRRRYVARFLHALDCFYCANVDYGSSTDREHYHAVICLPDLIQGDYKRFSDGWFIDCDLSNRWNEKYGFCNVQGPVNNDPVKVAKYITKLTNHAIKVSAHAEPLIYNKDKPTWALHKGD